MTGQARRQGRVSSVAEAGWAGRHPGVTSAGSPRGACSGPRCVTHSPARPAGQAGGRAGGGPGSPQGRARLSQARQGRAGRTRKLPGEGRRGVTTAGATSEGGSGQKGRALAVACMPGKGHGLQACAGTRLSGRSLSGLTPCPLPPCALVSQAWLPLGQREQLY